MAKLKIRKQGDEALSRICRPVEEITPRIVTLLDDMIETMRAADGCGLAAPQVGILRRIAVVEVEEGDVIELINPVILRGEGEQREAEGCLSLPGKWGITSRPAKVWVEATDRTGNRFEISGEGLLARALCHEIDHLDGHLFTERAVEMIQEED